MKRYDDDLDYVRTGNVIRLITGVLNPPRKECDNPSFGDLVVW